MALLNNRSYLHANPGKYIGGTVASGDRSNSNKVSQLLNWGYNADLDWSMAAIPYGYGVGSVVRLPKVLGAMVSRRQAHVVSSQTLSGAAGKPGSASASAQSSQTGVVIGEFAGSGTASAVSSQTATLQAVGLMTGEGNAYSSQTGVLIAKVSATGTAFAYSSQSLEGQLALLGSGAAYAVSSQDGSLIAQLFGAGDAFAVSSQAGSLIAAKAGTGAATAQSSQSGALIGEGYMLGSATALASQTGVMMGLGYMTGSTETTVGELTTGAIAAEVWSYVARTLTSGGGGGGGGLTVEQAQYLTELWQKEGLDINNPVTVDKALQKISVGDVNAPEFVINLGGNFKSLTTMERAP